MGEKLDTGRVWTDATRMMGANRELVLVLAGIFFFVPMMILVVSFLGSDFEFGAGGAEPDPEAFSQQINAIIMQLWWAILLVSLGQLAGAIALIGLLGDSGKPTVREAMALIPKLILTMIAAQILTAIATQGLTLLTGALPLAVQGILNFILFPISVYIAIKLTLAPAVIVLERELNPIKSIVRSWKLTKGNSFRIFIFYFMLIIAFVVVGLISAIAIGLVLALLGDRAQVIGGAAVVSAIAAGYYALSYAVLTAIYRQLNGSDEPSISQTFE